MIFRSSPRTVLSSERLLHGFGLVHDGVEDAAVASEFFAGGRLICGGLIDKQRAIQSLYIEGGYLHAGSGEADQISVVDLERHGREAGRGAEVLGQSLVQTHVHLREIRSDRWHHPAEQGGHAGMASLQPVVEI